MQQPPLDDLPRRASAAAPNPGGSVASNHFHEVYLALAPLLRHVAMHKFGVPACDADGLVHDVFATYWMARDRIHGEARPYLVGGICQASRRYWHHRRGEEPLFDGIGDCFDRNEEVSEAVAIKLSVGATLARLRPRCREVLRRYYLDGEVTTSIAAAMGTTASNILYILHGCRKRAREIYESLTKVPYGAR